MWGRSLSLIVTVYDNEVICKYNSLPWTIHEITKHFDELTMNSNVIMGRKCFESIGKKPLLNRNNIILTRNESYPNRGCTIVNSFGKSAYSINVHRHTFIIGGEDIYKQFLPYIHRIYLTRVHADVEGDTFFRNELLNGWKLDKLKTTVFTDNTNLYNFTFYEYVKDLPTITITI